MIDFLDSMALTPDKLHEEMEFLIDGFVGRGMITIFYSDGGNAKTWTAYSIAGHLLKYRLMDMVYYIDVDNPLPVIKERGVEDLLMNKFPNFKYLHRSELTVTPIEMLEELAQPEKCKNHAYKGMAMIVDSIRNVTDVKSDSKAMYMMELLLTIRDAGMTIACIAHTTKNAKNYDGSNNIKNSTDGFFKQRLLKSIKNQYVIVELTDEKGRSGTKDCVFKIDINTLDIEPADPVSSRLTPTEEDFIDKIQEALNKHPKGMNQGDLLREIGTSSTNKTIKPMLEKFIGEYYSCEEKGNSKIFKKI